MYSSLMNAIFHTLSPRPCLSRLKHQPDSSHTESMGRYNVEAKGVKFSGSADGGIVLVPGFEPICIQNIHDSLPSEISLMHSPRSLTRSECK